MGEWLSIFRKEGIVVFRFIKSNFDIDEKIPHDSVNNV